MCICRSTVTMMEIEKSRLHFYLHLSYLLLLIYDSLSSVFVYTFPMPLPFSLSHCLPISLLIILSNVVEKQTTSENHLDSVSKGCYIRKDSFL